MLSTDEKEKYATSAKIFLDSFYNLKDCPRDVLDMMKNSYCNEDDPLVQEFAKNFAVLFDKLVNHPMLVNAYNISEDLHFYRYQKVAQAFQDLIMPLKTYLDNGFFNTHNGRACTYRSISDLLINCNTGFDRTFIDKLCDYYDNLNVDEARNFYATRNEYFSLDEEIKEYFKAKDKKVDSNRYKNFYREKEYYYNTNFYDINYIDFQKEYESMILGNIGEILYFNEIKDKTCAIFSARDTGSYVGCDMTYYDERNRIERLVEVKTTATHGYDDETDEFYIGRTELPIIEESLRNNKICYEIKRVFLTFDEEKREQGITSCKITTLIPLNKETLIDEDGNIYRYIKSDEKCYFRCDSVKRKNKLVRN